MFGSDQATGIFLAQQVILMTIFVGPPGAFSPSPHGISPTPWWVDVGRPPPPGTQTKPDHRTPSWRPDPSPVREPSRRWPQQHLDRADGITLCRCPAPCFFLGGWGFSVVPLPGPPAAHAVPRPPRWLPAPRPPRSVAQARPQGIVVGAPVCM